MVCMVPYQPPYCHVVDPNLIRQQQPNWATGAASISTQYFLQPTFTTHILYYQYKTTIAVIANMAAQLLFAFLACPSRYRYQFLSQGDISPFSCGRTLGIGHGQDCASSVIMSNEYGYHTTTTITPTIVGSQLC